ncbi:MAG: hypothetical protein KAU90_07660, partial [Sulfurovaceae bacterium]|nr:hypothetical protein [Sulfurovaceae bacterium]
HFLSTLYMASILKMQSRTKEAEKLYKSVQYKLSNYQQKVYSNNSGNFESNIRDMFLHFIIKTKYFKKDIRDLAIIQKSFDDIYSTQEKAIALKALSIYLGKPKNSELNATLDINGKTTTHTRPLYTTIDKISSKNIKITPKSGAFSYNIELVKHLPKAIKNRLSKKKKLSIKREFINEQGKKVNLKSLKQGDTIYSKVTIENFGKINSVVVNQRIPACLSIVNSRIKDEIPNKKFQNQNINQEYKDIRDDRILNFIDLPNFQEYNIKTKKLETKRLKGVIFTPLLVTTKGVCKIPAVIAESMYDSRIGDYAKGVNQIRVIDTQSTKK